jgi:multidrug efflux pump subunit AcrA (membrane-fusion protein)
MIAKQMPYLVLSLIFTAIGLAGGWYAARQTKEAGAGGHAHGDGGHDEGEHAHAEPVKLSDQALRNLGVTVAEVRPGPWTRTLAIPAVIEDSPAAALPIVAPAGGRVLEVRFQKGQVARAGETFVTILRDAMPPPEFRLTEELLRPATEEFHGTVGALRKAVHALELAQEEMARLEKFAETGTQEGLPIVPRKNLIEAKYEVARAEKDVQIARAELRRHGCTEDQVAAIERGGPASPFSYRVWRQTLEQNGLWTEEARALHAALPEDVRDLPRTVAVIGELTAAGLVARELVEWLKSDPEAGREFLSLAALLQRGSTLEEARRTFEVGALRPVVEVKAPAGGPPDWDVQEVLVRPGEHVTPGARLAVLHDERRMILRAEALGGDAGALLGTVKEGSELAAVPLIRGSGPDLTGLRALLIRDDDEGHGTVAYVSVENEELATREAAGSRFRSWVLRPGLRYLLKVPVQSVPHAYVLPADAVTEDGADKVVWIRSGDTFRPAKVVVIHQDHEVAVLDGKHSELFPDDPVAQHSAFALGLALRAGKAGAEAGHGHSHDH